MFKSDAFDASRPVGRVAIAALLANAVAGNAVLAEQTLRMSYPADRTLSCAQLLAEQKRMEAIIGGADTELRRTAEARHAIITGLYRSKNCGDGRSPAG